MYMSLSYIVPYIVWENTNYSGVKSLLAWLDVVRVKLGSHNGAAS